MKLFGNDKGTVSPIVIVLAIALLVVAAFAVAGGIGGSDDAGADNESVDDAGAEEEVETTTGETFTGDLALSLKDWDSNAVATDSNVDAILTKQGVYADANAAFDEFKKEGQLVSPFATAGIAEGGSSAPVASVVDGVVTFTDVPASTDGTTFALFIYDPDTGTGDGNFNTVFGDITVKGSYSEYNDAESVKVIADTNAYFQSKAITLTERGTLAFFDSAKDDETVNTLTRDIEADAVLDDESAIFTVLLSNDKSVAEELGFYIGELDDVVGEMDMTIEKIYINGIKCDFTKMADVDDDTIEANEPTITGADTVYYIELAEDVPTTLTRVSDTNRETMEVKVIFDADSTGATVDAAGKLALAIVPTTGATEEPIGVTGVTGTLVIGETEAVTGWTTV